MIEKYIGSSEKSGNISICCSAIEKIILKNKIGNDSLSRRRDKCVVKPIILEHITVEGSAYIKIESCLKLVPDYTQTIRNISTTTNNTNTKRQSKVQTLYLSFFAIDASYSHSRLNDRFKCHKILCRCKSRSYYR